MKKDNESLQNWRTQIDAIDMEILLLISRRMEKVRHIGDYKKEHHLHLLNTKRREAVLKGWTKQSDNLHLSPLFLTMLFELFHDYALEIEADEKR